MNHTWECPRHSSFLLVHNRHTTIAPVTICNRGGTTLSDLSGILKQLKNERDRVQKQLSGLNAALEAFAAVYRNNDGTVLRSTR
jgi:hypothetical protein